MFTPAELSRIEALESRIAFLNTAVQATQGALINRAYSSGVNATTPHALTAGMALNYAAALIKSTASGIFLVSISVAWSGATTGDTGTFAITTQDAAAGAITLANNTSVSNVGEPGISVASGAGGVTITGGANAQNQASTPLKALTGVLQGNYSFTGIFNAAGGGAPLRFTSGHDVAILCSLNSTNAWTLGAVSMVVIELPPSGTT